MKRFLGLPKELDYIARSFGYPDIPGWKVRQFRLKGMRNAPTEISSL
jgi:hypothetical protein